MAAQTQPSARPAAARPVAPPFQPPRTAAPKPEPKKPLPKWRKGFAAAVPWLVAVYLCGIVIQVFLAGYGLTEVGGGGMQYHMAFAHIIELLPVLIILTGFLGADKWTGIIGIILLVLFQAQYFFIYAPQDFVRALHPTNALIIFGLTLALLLKRPMWHGKAF